MDSGVNIGMIGMGVVSLIGFAGLCWPVDHVHAYFSLPPDVAHGRDPPNFIVVTRNCAGAVYNGRNLVYVFILIQNGGRLVIFLSIVGGRGEKLFSLSFV